MFSSTPGIGGDRCAQVFVTDFKWSHFHPRKKKSEAGIALRNVMLPGELDPGDVFDDDSDEQDGPRCSSRWYDQDCLGGYEYEFE
jgi:hypothetical protein